MKLSLIRLLAVAAAAVALAAPAHAGPTSPEVPDNKLVPPAGNKLFLVAHAEGVQIYRCDPGNVWTLVAPRAELYSENGKPLGTHFGGPTWQARDGSYVTATKEYEVNVDATAINWLLLKKKATAAGAEGAKLVDTTYIQRINTTGGRAPAASECDVLGEIAEIGYTADYNFWKAGA